MKRVLGLVFVLLAVVGTANAQFSAQKVRAAAQPGGVQGSGAAGQLAIWTGATTLGGDANLTWNASLQKLFVGSLATIVGGSNGGGFLVLDSSDSQYGITLITPDGVSNNTASLIWSPLNTPEWTGAQLSPISNAADLGSTVSPWRNAYLSGNIVLPNLPTVDPQIPGALWQDPVTHVLMVSQ